MFYVSEEGRERVANFLAYWTNKLIDKIIARQQAKHMIIRCQVCGTLKPAKEFNISKTDVCNYCTMGIRQRLWREQHPDQGSNH
jgi:formylmethanofuran dehydrogenase subunit E